MFFIFFGIGACALTVSALCDDLTLYFQNKRGIAKAQSQLDETKDLIQVHDDLLDRLRKDPEMLKRIAPAVLGVQMQDPNGIYPLTGLEELMAARLALDGQKPASSIPSIPTWLVRCQEPRRRQWIFGAGGVLVLISFACFGWPERDRQ